jgi:hypothetical protein
MNKKCSVSIRHLLASAHHLTILKLPSPGEMDRGEENPLHRTDCEVLHDEVIVLMKSEEGQHKVHFQNNECCRRIIL